MRNHEAPLAIRHASEMVRLEPFREIGYQRLMQAHAMLGNRADVRRVYERCRKRLLEEVGLDPSPELEASYQTLLHQPSSVKQRWRQTLRHEGAFSDSGCVIVGVPTLHARLQWLLLWGC